MSDWKNSFIKLDPIRGWLLDVYPCGPNEMALWIIAENGERTRLVDKFIPKIYISGSHSNLKSLSEKIRSSRSVAGLRFIEKCADFMEAEKKKVLEVDITDYHRTSFFARKVLRLGGYELFHLYNVDVPVSQAYLYEKDLFPLAKVMVTDLGNRLSYDILDSVEKVDYEIPPLLFMWLNVIIKKKAPIQQFTDEIDSLSL